jgi:hypothetical protein
VANGKLLLRCQSLSFIFFFSFFDVYVSLGCASASSSLSVKFSPQLVFLYTQLKTFSIFDINLGLKLFRVADGDSVETSFVSSFLLSSLNSLMTSQISSETHLCLLISSSKPIQPEI